MQIGGLPEYRNANVLEVRWNDILSDEREIYAEPERAFHIRNGKSGVKL